MTREQDQFLEVVDRDTAEQRWWDWLRPEVLDVEEVPLGFRAGPRAGPRRGRRGRRAPLRPIERRRLRRAGPGHLRRRRGHAAIRSRSTPRKSPRASCPACPSSRAPPLDRDRRRRAARGRRRRDGRAHISRRRVACRSSGLLRLVRRSRSPGPTSPGANASCAAGRCSPPARRALWRPSAWRTCPSSASRDVAIVSTGDEIVAPGEPLRPAAIFDANSTLIADAVRELGASRLPSASWAMTITPLEAALEQGLATADLVLFSGGTSKGAGDLSYRTLARRQPGNPRPRRRAQARQADLPGSRRTQARRDPARLPDFGDLHVPRVRRPA